MNRFILIAFFVWWFYHVEAQTADSIGWRGLFAEPQLVTLIETALEHNSDLLTANLNVEQSEAQLKASRLSLLPSLALGAEGNLQATKGQSAQKTYNVPLTMQWEVDLSGRLRSEQRAEVANYWSTAETERAVRLQVISAVASTYYTLKMMNEQLNVTRESIGNAQQTVEVMQTLKEVGMQNELAVSSARAAYMSVSAQEKTLLQQIRAAENALVVLVGKQIEVNLNDDTTTQLFTYDTSYPLEILANRPDVKAAEHAVKAQMAQVDMARAAFYPQLNISASLGWTNLVGEVVNPGQMLLSAIASMVQPLFNKGQNRANLHIAKARQKQTIIAFNQALLMAGTELSDALTACRLSRERLTLREQEVDAAERAYEVSKVVMLNSSSTYLEVLTAQQSLLQSRLSLTTERYDFIQGQINLYKALGGDEKMDLR